MVVVVVVNVSHIDHHSGSLPDKTFLALTQHNLVKNKQFIKKKKLAVVSLKKIEVGIGCP